MVPAVVIECGRSRCYGACFPVINPELIIGEINAIGVWLGQDGTIATASIRGFDPGFDRARSNLVFIDIAKIQIIRAIEHERIAA